ncbi:aminomethyl-transferring glycine dehydrogenase subunit GcvPA [Microbacterium pseudoresistens]|uniref:Glycine dehydrogenase subunit 1 n=1 Tax=Microbacterium pseudoresistens TaxID=640634 RepID=A0A7Y9EVL5_9MICO|nr:aminomethyl-transferring glycine dehydrogenase subunit GcvPA [Microbacterium pseudoresistens]NYD54634.1 glycine dehydrogenase subunit 1 [Microbacterium pseudoresistens]
MREVARFAHPYIPNSAPVVKAEMLATVGVADVDELYASIPNALRFEGELDLPSALESEVALRRHMNGLLARNVTAGQTLSFLGAGCYQHYVPSICGEINSRAEFLTAYAGEPYEDHGKWQAIFEYTSLMADLLEMDVVNVPNYDGYQAAATALRMAVRMTGRATVLVSDAVLADKRRKIESYLEGAATVVVLPVDRETGRVVPSAVEERMGDDVAAVYLETPNALGVVETELSAIAGIAHGAGGLLICGVEPLALGFLESPASSGADILCGDIQALGLGMHFGGAHGGFIATHDEETFVYEFPSRLFGIAPTVEDGELGFTDVAYERTSLAMREEGIEWVGTAAALWGITAGVYLSLLGPHGLSELGETVAANTRYAIERIRVLPGAEIIAADAPHWREFAVRFEGRTAAEVESGLRGRGIFGAVPLRRELPDLGETVLFAVTEIHSSADIDRLADALEGILA